MTAPSDKTTQPFDEDLISGYLDGTLGHRQAQRVRLLIEENGDARRLYQELRALRQATLATRFEAPGDDVWPELPKTPTSRFSRRVGWLVLLSWLTVMVVMALWSLFQATGDPLQILLVLGLPGAFVLLLVSVFIDRLRDPDEKRYRGVFR
ncbi:MAG: hypothetical protein MPN21_04170 [Thermoanaerobaculia bacterium]|nr:hypothetical protein [Thermoanaerobaculia bacterium]